MKVKEMIAKLAVMNPEAECHWACFDGFLTEYMEWSKESTDIEGATAYGIDVEYKTIYEWDHRRQQWSSHTGAIFEVD